MRCSVYSEFDTGTLMIWSDLYIKITVLFGESC